MNPFTEENKEIVRWVDENSSTITEMSDRLWLYAEPMWSEYRSARHLANTLRKAGFSIQEGSAGLDTAFVATYGEGSPILCTYAEYDTIKGNSQMPMPYKCAVIPGLSQGTYDMHHGLGAGAVGAALAIKYVMEKYKIPGTFKMFGIPAEKISIGKNVMENEGLLDNLDACIAWHPSDVTSSDCLWNYQWRCNNYTRHTFTGVPVYGALPWGGRNAFHAVELMDVAVQFLKESIVPVTHLPNIQSAIKKEYSDYAISSVPGIAQVEYISRSKFRRDHELIQQKLFDCANAAALALGVTVKNEVLTGTWEGYANQIIAKLAHQNIEVIGPPRFTEKDFEYGRLVAKQAGIEIESGTPFGDMSIVPPDKRLFRQDLATSDTSTLAWKCPTIVILVNYLIWGWPDWTTSSWAITNIAHQCILTASKIIATTALDLYRNPKTLGEAKDEHHKRVKDTNWYNPLPKGQPKPKGERLPKEHYMAVIEAFKRGPKWEGWEPELSQRMDKIIDAVKEELST